ncbi:hypothetical protein [Natrinema sp. SYSU A 869]|nr:hypothetical protein [Natrinema sp. SYSU A 869]
MEAQSRQKGAARCTDCGRALAVWVMGNEVRPIGSTDGCPCGGTSFRVFS